MASVYDTKEYSLYKDSVSQISWGGGAGGGIGGAGGGSMGIAATGGLGVLGGGGGSGTVKWESVGGVANGSCLTLTPTVYSSDYLFFEKGTSTPVKIKADGTLEGDFSKVDDTNCKALVNLARKFQEREKEFQELTDLAKRLDKVIDMLMENVVVKKKTEPAPINPIFSAVAKMHKTPNAPDSSVMENCNKSWR